MDQGHVSQSEVMAPW